MNLTIIFRYNWIKRWQYIRQNISLFKTEPCFRLNIMEFQQHEIKTKLIQ